MKVTIHPSGISGIINAPPSKSSMQRICAAALLHKGTTLINNPGNSKDDLAAIKTISLLGAQVHQQNNSLVVSSKGINPISSVLNCGESGLGLRMFAPIAALSAMNITLEGEGTLNNRPMDFFDGIFPQLNVDTKSNNGKLPLSIKGPLHPKSITIDGSLSSQFLTGLLFAYAAACTEEVVLEVTNLVSKPYIDLTIDVLKTFGYHIINQEYRQFIIKPASKSGKLYSVSVEGDWSGASFLLVAAAIAGEVTVSGLQMNSSQADRQIIEALRLTGTEFSETTGGLHVSKSELSAFEFDATECPDLFPPLVALAAYCRGISKISGVHRLKHKESDRGFTLQQEFAKLGVSIGSTGNDMIVNGTGTVIGAEVHSHHDHRIAMACSVAALNGNGSTTIAEAEAINKSYPSFYADLKQLKAVLELH